MSFQSPVIYSVRKPLLIFAFVCLGVACGSGNSIGTAQKPSSVRFSQIQTEAAFRDKFVLTPGECDGVQMRWGYLPKEAVPVDEGKVTLSDLFLNQRKSLILRSITIEVVGGTEAEVAVGTEKNSSRPRLYRVFQGVPSKLTAKMIKENPGATIFDAELGRDKKAAFTFSEKCASQKDVLFKNQNIRATFPTEIVEGGQYVTQAQLEMDFSKGAQAPENFALETGGVKSFGPELNFAENKWEKRHSFYTDSTFILQYTRRSSNLIELSPSAVVEGDASLPYINESQLTLTLVYQKNETDPNPEAWTRTK